MSAPETSVPISEAGVGYIADPPRNRQLRILVIDDDRSLREGCVSLLQQEGHIVENEGRGDTARDLVSRRRFDLVLLDSYMTPVTGLEILRAIREHSPDSLVVMMTGNASVENSIEAYEGGAWEYLAKPFSAAQLSVVVGRAAHHLSKQQPHPLADTNFSTELGSAGERMLLGVSPAFRRALALARQVAPTDASVVITGESGTGKEMIARFIHAHSRRAARPLIPVNCAALPEALLESEMFGHVKGSFTGADRDKVGLLEAAHEGTMFLDEITEMSHAIQAKFLRVLQDGVVRRVGSERESRQVDVRFIAATNRIPQEAVREGLLRHDLYFRLWVFPIHLPPLRERPEDIVHLAEHFLSHYWARHRGSNLRLPPLSPEAIGALTQRPWPGNVRELQNTMERLAVLAAPGQSIRAEDLPAMPASTADAPAAPAEVKTPQFAPDVAFHPAKERLLAEFERSYLTTLVRRSGRNLSRAARLAGIDRTTLYRLLEKHGIDRSDLDADL